MNEAHEKLGSYPEVAALGFWMELQVDERPAARDSDMPGRPR